jgi:hypothetical protein
MTARSLSRTRGSFVLALIAVSTFGPRLNSAPRNEDPASGASSLKKELAPLAYFGGHWTCTGVFPSTGKEIASDLVARVGLDGAWLVLRHDDAPPNRFHATELWGFDQKSQQFVAYIFDNFGGARKFTSPGWADIQWIWSGESSTSGPAASERFVFTRVSAEALTTSYEVKRGSADWAIGDKLTCKR